MNMLELDDIADVIATTVKEALAPLVARIEALEQRATHEESTLRTVKEGLGNVRR